MARHSVSVGRFGVESGAREGELAEIAIGQGALRFFDKDTGARIGA